jgi:hypothetical protein
VLISVAAIMLSTAGMPAATQADAAVRSEISFTPHGRILAVEARARFRAYGRDVADEAVRVVRLEDGSVMVVPASYRASDIQLGKDGSVRVTTKGIATSSNARVPLAAAAVGWTQQGATRCYSRTIKTPHGNNGGWMDTCYRLYKVTGESDSTYDYWNITAFATVDATRIYTTGDYAWIHVDKDGGPKFYWEDWDPRSDLSGNCGARSLSISALGFGLGFGTTVCESWLLTKYAAAGHLKVQWNGDSPGAREVALMSAIHLAQGGTPVWGISWNSVLKCYAQVAC